MRRTPVKPAVFTPSRMRRRTPLVVLAPLAGLLSGCGLFQSGSGDTEVTPPPVEASTAPASEPAPAPARPYRFGDWSRETLEGLTLRQKVGQMMMPIVLGDYAPKGTRSHDRIAELIEDAEVGGVIVSVGSPTDVAVKLNDLQGHAHVPLLVGSDLETGPGFRLSGAVHSPTNIVLGGATQFPNLMALGATGDAGLAYEMGRITGLEARAVGIHLPFAPVLDVNNNPDNPIINVRSFGEEPALVARLGTAFVRGVQEHGGVATGKHFPGHGDTGVDSHLELPVIQADRARMDTVELRPFQAAVDAGMGAVMTAHITVPALNGGNGDPSTLSPAVMDGLLRNQMGFDGLLVTDAMDMGAIDRGWGREEATILAVEAGADIILMPPSPSVAIDALVSAVMNGRVAESRIDESVLRILEAKERMGLHRQRTVDLNRIPEVVGIPAHTEVARRVARRSVTLLRNDGDLLPLLGTRSARVLSVSYHREADNLAGRYFNRGLRDRYPRLRSMEVHPSSDSLVYRAAERRAGSSDLVVVSLYVTAVSYSGSVAIPEEASAFIESLVDRGIPHVVVSFGNPYLIREFPSVRSYLLTYSGSPASQRAAAEALFGDIPIQGRLPTRIPPLFDIGDGIQLPVREPVASQ